jgi:biopolymer transport protein ExbB/TolQ
LQVFDKEITMGIAVAALPAGATIVAGILNYMATTGANKENLRLAEQARRDTLATQREANKIARKQHTLNVRQQQFVESEAGLNRAERLEERGYGRTMSSYQRAADLLGQNYDLLAKKTAPFMKRG